MKNYKITTALLCAGYLTLAASCNDGKEENLTPNLIYMVNSGVQKLAVFDFNAPLTYQLAIYKSGALTSGASAQIAPLTDDEMNRYNTENGTNYTLLPPATYAIKSSEFVFTSARSDIKQSTEIVFNTPQVVDALSTSSGTESVLAVKIKEASIAINENKSICIIKPELEVPLLDKTTWTVTANTEEAGGEGPVNGYARCLIDGDEGTFWHSAWKDANPVLPHHLIIDMKKEYTVTQIDLVRRKGNKDTKGGKFYISTDNQNWTQTGEFTLEETDAAQSFLVTRTKGRYLRISITESRNSPHANMAEAFAYGY